MVLGVMKFKIEHPSAFITKELVDIIRQASPQAEQLHDLHDDQLNLIYQQGWFKMFLPKEYHGLGWSLPDVLKMEEGLSWTDGSTAWVVTLCGGAGWFSGFLQPSLLKEILLNDKICFAGSGAATGTANLVPDGYEVNGFWKYASGSLHATVFTANCIIQKDGRSQYNTDGTHLLRAILFQKEEEILHRLWNSMGMIATASHSFEVKALKVPVNRCFAIDAKYAILKNPVYRYPFLQLAETTLTINLCGMAVRFLDLCGPIFSKKMQQRNTAGLQTRDLQELLASAKAELDQHRFAFYTSVERSWQVCECGKAIAQVELNDVSKTSYALAHRSLRIVDELYPYCGLTAANTRMEINRVWRNIHTASQHALFTSGL
jgi:alkylation response protein AidB-like acyl-CoA dehydrogenase